MAYRPSEQESGCLPASGYCGMFHECPNARAADARATQAAASKSTGVIHRPRRNRHFGISGSGSLGGNLPLPGRRRLLFALAVPVRRDSHPRGGHFPCKCCGGIPYAAGIQRTRPPIRALADPQVHSVLSRTSSAEDGHPGFQGLWPPTWKTILGHWFVDR